MAASTKEKSPKTITVRGRLSFPTFTAKEAYDKSQKGTYPAADIASASPDFQLLVEQSQLDKLRDHVINTFFPYCIEQEAKGEKRDVLSKKEVADLTKQIKAADFDGVFNTPFKPIHEKTAPLVPECVATFKVIGNKGQDFELKAVINDEDDLAVADPDRTKYPDILPINETKFSMYPGCHVIITCNLYAYHNGKLPGFSLGGSVPIFKMDGDRLGGGVTVDEDEIFAD